MSDQQPDSQTAGQEQVQDEQVHDEKVRREEFQVTGEDVVAKIKELIHEGNVRRIILKNEEGKTLIEIPLTLGVVGVILLPVWAAIGAIAALAVRLTIVIEKVERGQKPG
jgi:hypothetical protein